ncbi:MAG: glycosyltransferase family 4 protein [Thermoleophilaceae bacterium]
MTRARSEGSPPRALVVTQNVPVPSDRRVWNEVSALRRAGWEVVVICPRGEDSEYEPFEQIDGISVLRYSQPRAGGSALGYLYEYGMAYWCIRRLARELADARGFDVVQAANPPDFLLIALRFLKRQGAQLIFDHHDLSPELFLARFNNRKTLLYWILRLVERINFRLADIVIATNESYQRIAVGRGGKRPEDVYVVRNGPLLAHFKPVAPQESLKRGRRYLISYMGEMAPQDGVDHALRAFAHLREERDDWHAVLAGDGDAAAGLRQLAEQLELGEQVEFSGWLLDPELRLLLCSSDVCLVPDPKTTLSDASTLIKIAEYMALARPVVAYDLTESRITAGDAALYARPNEPRDLARAISELLDDPERRERMGAIGRARVIDGLSWERAEHMLLAAYDAALARAHAQ